MVSWMVAWHLVHEVNSHIYHNTLSMHWHDIRREQVFNIILEKTPVMEKKNFFGESFATEGIFFPYIIN